MSSFISKINKIGKLNFIFILLSIFMLSPFFYAIQYALPYGDDFYMMGVLKKSSDSLFLASIKETIRLYNVHGGSFLPFFLEFFLLGLTKFSFYPVLHFILASIFIFFFFSFFIFIKEFARNFQLEKIEFILFFFILLVGLNTTSPDQAFYATVCVISYEFFFAVSLLSFACFINYTRTDSKKSFVGAIICGIVGSNMHSFAAVLNLIYFSYLIYFYVNNKKINFKILALFFAVFITALIVSFAPGNFVRHSVISNEMHFTKVFITSAIIVIKYAYNLFENSFLIFGGACLFFMTLFIRKPTRYHLCINPIILALFFLILCYLFVFPICLGYAGDHTLPNRSKFLLDFIMTFSFFAFTIYSSEWLRNKYTPALPKEQFPIIILIFTLLLAVEIQNIGLKNFYFVKCVKEISNGTMKEFYESGKDILSAIENSPDNEVVVYGEKKDSVILFPIGLMAGENNNSFWVNSFIADYYGKKSVTYLEH